MSRRLTIAVALALVGAWTLAAGEALGADDDHAHGRRRAPAARECAAECMDKMAAVNQHLDAAVKALEAGEKESALTHLKAARSAVKSMHQTCTACMGRDKRGEKETSAGAEFANAHCPVMGGKIDPAKVTPKQTREWQGKKIAFCCPSCTGKWEQMSEEQKKAALEKAVRKPAATPAPALEEKEHDGGCCPRR